MTTQFERLDVLVQRVLLSEIESISNGLSVQFLFDRAREKLEAAPEYSTIQRFELRLRLAGTLEAGGHCVIETLCRCCADFADTCNGHGQSSIGKMAGNPAAPESIEGRGHPASRRSFVGQTDALQCRIHASGGTGQRGSRTGIIPACRVQMLGWPP